MNKLYMNLNVT